MSYILLIIVVLSILKCSTKFGWNSFLSIGMWGTAIYTSPAIIGLYFPFDLYDRVGGSLFPPTNSSIIIYIIIWSVFYFIINFLPKQKMYVSAPYGVERIYLFISAMFGVLGYVLLSAVNGPLFFLDQQGEIGLTEVSTLWRWTFVFGMLVSIIHESKRYFIINLYFIVITFIAGDRTVPAISFSSILFLSYLGRRKLIPFPPLQIVLISFFAFFFLIFGKPVYQYIKTGNAELVTQLWEYESFMSTLYSFEPLGTYNFIEFSIRNHVVMPVDSFVSGILGHFLLIPSIFGVNVNLYNTYMTGMMPEYVKYGIAGNYYAHGYAVFGYVGVIVFSSLFIFSLFFLQRHAIKYGGVSRIFIVIIASIISIYSHRNGIDNLLSFVRQVVIVFLVFVSVKKFIYFIYYR